MQTSELAAWSRKTREAIATAERLSAHLDAVADIPAGGSDAERLAVLGELWSVLGVSRPSYPAIDIRAGNLAAKLKADIEPCQYALRRLLIRVHEEMVRLIDHGVTDPKRPVLTRADFGADGCLTIAGDDNLLFAPIDRLPPNHWARGLLPADDLYQLAGRGCLLLGNAQQRYFETETVKRLTRNHRMGQKNQEEDARRKEENDRRERQAARERDPLYRVGKLEEELQATKRRLAEMEAQANGTAAAKC